MSISTQTPSYVNGYLYSEESKARMESVIAACKKMKMVKLGATGADPGFG